MSAISTSGVMPRKCDKSMTLETAQRIVQEQGEIASKEAMAVVRGGMTICELTADGRRIYPWIKVLPTKTDGESSIEQALKLRREKNMPSNKKKLAKQEANVTPTKVQEVVSSQVSKVESPVEDNSISIHTFISKCKQKLCELWKMLDEIVVE
jgi:hypothetical protein